MVKSWKLIAREKSKEWEWSSNLIYNFYSIPCICSFSKPLFGVPLCLSIQFWEVYNYHNLCNFSNAESVQEIISFNNIKKIFKPDLTA